MVVIDIGHEYTAIVNYSSDTVCLVLSASSSVGRCVVDWCLVF